MTPIADVKRFLELHISGHHFLAALRDEPEKTLARYRLSHLDPEELRPLYDPAAAGVDAPVSPLVQAYRDQITVKLQWRDQIRSECCPVEPRFRTWHQRQVARCRAELSAGFETVLIHTPLAVELALGCSVGCWYCSLDAQPLRELFRYTEDTAPLWREMLQTLKKAGGDAMKWGCMYWACEPMDNPDFERFCDDFHQVFGMYPQTTTTAPLRNPERTRALLADSYRKGCLVNRFSVNSLADLERILETFSAEELANTELIMQNDEAVNSFKANAGRSTRHFTDFPEDLLRERQKIRSMLTRQAEACGGGEPAAVEEMAMAGTTSCMTGFLINMVEKRVRLISPCDACERWPLGYMVFAEDFFTDAASFQTVIDRIMENMVIELPNDRPLKFPPWLTYTEIEEGFALQSRHARYDIKNRRAPGYFRQIGELVRDGVSTAGAIALQCNFQFGASESLTRGVLNDLFTQGVLDEGL